MQSMKKVEVLRAACCVAGADGQTGDAERRILELLANEVGVGEASLSAMISRAEGDPEFWREQFRVLKFDPAETMQLLMSVALVDGELTDSESAVLKRLASQLEIPSDTFARLETSAVQYLKKSKVSG